MNEHLMDQLLTLSPAEKIDLIGKLWDSIPPAELPPLTEAQIKELNRRLVEHKADPSSAIPIEEFRARLRARFK